MSGTKTINVTREIRVNPKGGNAFISVFNNSKTKIGYKLTASAKSYCLFSAGAIGSVEPKATAKIQVNRLNGPSGYGHLDIEFIEAKGDNYVTNFNKDHIFYKSSVEVNAEDSEEKDLRAEGCSPPS